MMQPTFSLYNRSTTASCYISDHKNRGQKEPGKQRSDGVPCNGAVICSWGERHQQGTWQEVVASACHLRGSWCFWGTALQPQWGSTPFGAGCVTSSLGHSTGPRQGRAVTPWQSKRLVAGPSGSGRWALSGRREGFPLRTGAWAAPPQQGPWAAVREGGLRWTEGPLGPGYCLRTPAMSNGY